MNTIETLIDIQHVNISFDNQVVLQDVSLQLKNGENLVVLGKSGSGKSVLIKCIVRLLQSDFGTINVFGVDINSLQNNELHEFRKRIGFLFQSGALYDSMSVKQNLEFPLRRNKTKLTEKEINAKVKEVLKNVGLSDSIDKMPSQLSGGMRKRISLARTIIVEPQIILYDEPTTGLDPITSDEISSLIIDLQKQYKISSIIITHDIACAKKIANRLVMLNNGLVYKEGSIKQFETSNDEFITSFFN